MMNVVLDQFPDLAALRRLLLIEGLRGPVQVLHLRSVQLAQQSQGFPPYLRNVHIHHQGRLFALPINTCERFTLGECLEKGFE